MNIDEANAANRIATFKYAVDELRDVLDSYALASAESGLLLRAFDLKSVKTNVAKDERFALRERAVHLFNRLEGLRSDIEDLSTQSFNAKAAIEEEQSNV